MKKLISLALVLLLVCSMPLMAFAAGTGSITINGVSYDVKTDKTKDFGDRAPEPPKAEKLSNPVMKEEKGKQESHVDQYGVDMSKDEHSSEQSKNTYRTR